MTKKRRPNGVCHICGEEGPLSFEHVPPKAAFNDQPVIGERLIRILNQGPGVKFHGPISQKGHGRFTLCDRCNNVTGSWYGTSFASWCYQGMEILHRSGY